MAVRKAEAAWEGTLKEGKGQMKLGSGAWEGPFTWSTRFGDENGANPEELIGAAQAGCFSMFLSALLTANGTPPTSIVTTAKVHLNRDDIGPLIDKIELNSTAVIPDIDQEKFDELTLAAKAKCPISRALGAVPELTLTATLVAAADA